MRYFWLKQREIAEKSHACSLPHLFFPHCVQSVVAHAAAVRPQQAASDANVSSPSFSSEKDLLLQPPFISEGTAEKSSSLHQNLVHSFLSLVLSISKVEACWLHLLSSLKIPSSRSSHFYSAVLDVRIASDVIKLEFFLEDWSFLCDVFPPSSLVVGWNQDCPFSFPHMPQCLPEYSFLRSTGSASMRRCPRTWSTGSAAARASASRRAGSGEVGAKITQTATAAPSEPVQFPEMENQVGGVRLTEVHGSLSRGYLCIPPSAPIRGEGISENLL